MYKITETGVTFHHGDMHAHFPDVSLPAVLSQGDLDHLGLEVIPDPVPTAEELAALTEAARIESIPESVSPRQIRQALTRARLRQQVEDAVAAGDQDLKDWWEFSAPFERGHPQVAAMTVALGITQRQVEDLWALAGSL